MSVQGSTLIIAIRNFDRVVDCISQWWNMISMIGVRLSFDTAMTKFYVIIQGNILYIVLALRAEVPNGRVIIDRSTIKSVSSSNHDISDSIHGISIRCDCSVLSIQRRMLEKALYR